MFKRFCFLVMILLGQEVSAESFWMDQMETDDLRLLYFGSRTSYLVPHIMRSFENSMEFQRYIFDWTPYEKVTVMVLDNQDYGNGAAMASPRNALFLYIAPLRHTFETFPAVERIYQLMNHELVHIATKDVATDTDRKWRRFLGGKPYVTSEHPESLFYHFMTAPRDVSPRWYSEGSAVFFETWMSGGLGRAQGAYDEMKFRAMVRDDQPFYSNLGLVAEGTSVDFQTEANAYFYGTRFFSYLAYTYSPEKVVEWLRREEGSKRYYSDQFEFVFSKPLEQAWDDWIKFEREFQQANLDALRTVPLTARQPLVQEALGSVSRSFIDSETNSLIGGFYYPGVVAHLGVLSLEDGSIRPLTYIKGPMKYKVTSTAYDPVNRVLFYTEDNFRRRDLLSVDLEGNKSRMLFRDIRMGDLAFNRADQSLWGMRNEDGYVVLVRIPPPYDEWEDIHTWPYGQVLTDLDISPDGSMLSATMEEINGDQFLRLFRIDDLLNGRFEHFRQFDFGRAVPEGFVFSPDGKYLFGSSFYTGVSNIYRYEIATAEIEAVSNSETGFFLPIPMEDGSLIVFEYTGQGLLPTRIDPVPLEDLSATNFLGNEIVKKHPVVTEWGVGSPADIDLDALDPQQGEFHPVREPEYTAGYPVIEGYKNTFALGWHARWEDPLGLNTLKADLSYSVNGTLPSSERLHANIEYETLYWRFQYWHNYADFYDLFGPTERARKGDAFKVGYTDSLIYDGPRLLDVDLEAAYYTGLDTLPGNQNVEAQFEELLSARAQLIYKHTQESLGAVDHEQGIRWNLSGYADHAHGDIVAKLRAGFDFGFALPLKHSSVWLYNAAGIAGGNRNDPLGNWYFGAFGNNYVDDKEVKRYREFYSFPGFDIDELSAQDFAKTILEWNLPPVRFDNIGIPSAFLSSARAALFAGALLTDIGASEYRENYFNLGFQVDFKFTVAHRYPMMFSVGYAQGYLSSEKYNNEVMVSLKVL
jgi:hypothetical protein